MKKQISLFILALAIHGTLIPQESNWKKAKKALTSKPAMLLYGITLGTGSVILANKLVSLRSSKILEWGEKIHTNITELQGLPNYLCERVKKIGGITNSADMHNDNYSLSIRFCYDGNVSDKTRYILYNFHGEYTEYNNVDYLKVDTHLKEIQKDLESYNKYLKSIGKLSYEFIYEYDKENPNFLHAIKFYSNEELK